MPHAGALQEMTDLKPKFRDELDRFAETHFGAKISNLGEKQRSDALTLCYLTQIRNALLPGSVPDEPEELQDYICDSSYDRTVDFLYRDDNNHVTIIQTKHRAPSKSEDASEFESFRGVLRKLCPETRPGAKINQKLLDIASEIEWEADSFTLIYLSLARHSPQIGASAEQDIDDVPNSPLKDISSRTELLYLSEDEINKQWRDVVEQRTGISPTVDILLADSSGNNDESPNYFIVENASGIRSYVGTLSAQQIHHLYTRYRDKLFNLNIRNYIGDTRTNKDIITSASTEAENFFFYNNGISAVASKVRLKSNGDHEVLNCVEFSVINGAQTFRSISKAHARRGASGGTKHLRVLVRISEVDFHKSSRADMLDNITRYNNTQNSMRLSDFRSNDPVQMSLVRYVSQLPSFGGKGFVYRNKRSGGGERNKITIKMDEFCRAVFAYQFGPPDYFGGLSHLYDTGTDGGYVKLFGPDLQALSQKEFDRLFGIWLLTAHAGDVLKEEKRQSDENQDEYESLRKSALERKYLTFFALGEAMREIVRLRKIDEAELLRSYSKPKWQEDNGKVAFVTKAFSVACDMVVQAYQMAQTKVPFVHRNFFRDEETLSNIRSSKVARRANLQELSAGLK
jgi:hypothetical protein